MTRRQTAKAAAGAAKPRITLTAIDHDRLSGLARAAMATMPDVASCLADELDRARVLAKGRPAHDIVRMGSEVEYRDEMTGKTQRVTLVYPGEADISLGRISVLTPIGTALIGLGVGQSINWETRTGDLKRLAVLEIREPQPA